MRVSAWRSIGGCCAWSARASGDPCMDGMVAWGAPMHPRVVESVLELVGGTPLVRLRRVGGSGRADVWAKMEQSNPGGSVKDRICLAMIEEAERAGKLAPGGVVVEPTSGNTGIGLAIVCAVKGY